MGFFVRINLRVSEKHNGFFEIVFWVTVELFTGKKAVGPFPVKNCFNIKC